MMLQDYIFSDDGFSFLRKFRQRFDCMFRLEVPGGMLVMDEGDDAYKLPESMTTDEFKKLVGESISVGKNLVKLKCSKIEYVKGTVY